MMLTLPPLSPPRSLFRKRKDLEEARENSKVLRAQLRSKKKGIHTLEALLKENARQNRHRRGSRRPSPPPHTSGPAPTAAGALLSRFFVTGPNGLCVEFHQRGSSTIGELKREVSPAPSIASMASIFHALIPYRRPV